MATEPCGAEHPEMPGVLCEKPRPCYVVHWNETLKEPWPGPPIPDKESRKKEVDAMAADIPRPKTTGPPEVPEHHAPFVRNNDPPNSHEAIEVYEPKRETIKAAVLAHFQARLGEWLDSAGLDAVGGGKSGERRMRELRREGWPIEGRRVSGNNWQHRLVSMTRMPRSYREAILLSIRYVALTQETVTRAAVMEDLWACGVQASGQDVDVMLSAEPLDRKWVKWAGEDYTSLIYPDEPGF